MQFRGLEEATIATIVGVIIQILRMVIPDWNWEEFKWRNLVRLVMCEVVSYGIFSITCFTDVTIPGMSPICGAQGAFNAGVAGILAFLVNKYAEEEAARWIKNMSGLRIWLPVAILGLVGEGLALLIGLPFLALLPFAIVSTVGAYAYGLGRATARGLFSIRLSTILFILLAVAKALVESPGNPLGLSFIFKVIALIGIWVAVLAVSLLTRFGVIREK
jgi:hypothetical protein